MSAQPTTSEIKTKGHIAIPTPKVYAKTSKRSAVGMVYRPTSKVTTPSPPRTRTLWLTKVGPSTGSNVGDLACDDEYIGETSRTFGERFKEHLKEPALIHQIIIGREGHGIVRTIKESIYIRVNNPTLNTNIGKFNLHHIGDRVLLNTPDLKIKGHVQAIGHG